MKRIGSVVVCCIGVAAIGAGLAFADNSTPNPNQVAATPYAQCELHAMGVKAFKASVRRPAEGPHAMRNCQRQHGKPAHNDINNAAQQCKAEQADPRLPGEPPAGSDRSTQSYGTNAQRSERIRQARQHQGPGDLSAGEQNLQNAAQQCRGERNEPPTSREHTGKSFTDFYGSNQNKKNAFGKCVSQTEGEGAADE